MNQYKSAYYAVNKEIVKAKSRAYYAANKEKVKAKAKERRERDKEKIQAKKRAYQRKVTLDPVLREKRNEKKRQRYHADIERRRIVARVHYATRRVRLATNISDPGDYQQFCELSKKLDAQCAYCGEFLVISGATVDHILPVVRGGTNNKENLCLACEACNKSKCDKTVEEWRKGDS